MFLLKPEPCSTVEAGTSTGAPFSVKGEVVVRSKHARRGAVLRCSRLLALAALAGVAWASAAAAAPPRQAFVPADLQAAATAHPDAAFDVIVQGAAAQSSARVASGVDSEWASARRGAHGIRRQFLSISGVSAQLTGAQILHLSRRPWILAITPDIPLRATIDLPPIPPQNGLPPVISGTAQVAATLTAAVGTWSGSEAIAYTYQWLRCDVATIVCGDVAGAAAPTYSVGTDDVGSTLRVVVTATNAAGAASATSAATPVVSPPPPANVSPPALSGVARAGETLTASSGAWTGASSYAYQWQRCDAAGAQCADVAGGGAVTYTPAADDVGGTLRVVVTALGAGGSAAAASPASDVVARALPVNVALPAVLGGAQEGATLTASAGTWSGTPTYAYQWQRCDAATGLCADIVGATDPAYTASTADIGSTLRVSVTAANSAGTSTASSLPTAAVTVAGPANSVLPAVTGTAQQGAALAASGGVWTGAAPIAYAYQWQRCDAAAVLCVDLVGATSATYGVAAGDVGATLRVRVTATNAGGSTSAVSAPSAGVLPLPPTNQAPPLVSGSPQDGSTLTASPGTWTTAGSYAYRWSRCNPGGSPCSNIAGAAASVYAATSADVGSVLRVSVTATNGAGSATATSLPSAPIRPAPPSTATPPTIGGTAQERETLTATPGTWNGTAPLTYAYGWQRCGADGTCADIAGASADTYVAVDADVGATLRILVTASNAAGIMVSASAQTVPVVPARPVNVVRPSVGGAPSAGNTLTAGAGSWTSAAPIQYAYQWQRCDATGASCASIAGATHASYVADVADIEGSLRIVVTATNAGGATAATSAPTALVAPNSLSGFWSRQQWPYATGAPALWDSVATGGYATPAIAIVDSGVDASVAGLNGGVEQVSLTSLPQSTAPDGYGHGTFVAGIAAGARAGSAGAAPGAHVVSIDVLDDNGMARTSDVIAAADWIYQHKDAEGIRVANFSLTGSAQSSMQFDPLDKALERLWFTGVVVVTAAGNYGVNGQPTGVSYAPANDPFAITVGAADLAGTIARTDDFAAPWSVYGHTLDGFAKPELGAAGRYMVAAVPTDSTLYRTRPDRIVQPGYMQLSGTSFAAPVVSGIAADLLAVHPGWTPDQVKGALMLSAAVAGAAAPQSLGVGEVDASGALAVADPPNPNLALDAFVGPDPAGGPAPVFDAASWGTTAQANASWGTASWGTASWGTASWGTASWGTAYWSSASWGTASWGTAAPDGADIGPLNDNAGPDLLPAGGYWMTWPVSP